MQNLLQPLCPRIVRLTSREKRGRRPGARGYLYAENDDFPVRGTEYSSNLLNPSPVENRLPCGAVKKMEVEW